jgi:hypothetical protein
LQLRYWALPFSASQVSPTQRMGVAAVSTVADFTAAVSTAYFHRGGTYYTSPWWGSYPDYGYYDYSQPYTGQTWYYCSDPAGYYPYVTQSNTGWQPVPAS